MRIIDKFINFVFSIIIMVLSLSLLFVALDLASIDLVYKLVDDYLLNPMYGQTVKIILIALFLASLKVTLLSSELNNKKKAPIFVSSENGTIQIAPETIETAAKAVAKSHDEVKDVTARMINKTKGIDLYMTILVEQDINIRGITRMIQEEVKGKIHDTTGVLVLNTDIKVKNLVEKNKKVITEKEEQSLGASLDREAPLDESETVEENNQE